MTSDAWWLDEARTKLSEDAFDRGPFVERVVEALDRVGTHSASTVVGLVGPWGSGKTSIVNFVLDSLDKDRWQPVHFNPWAINSQESLIAEFCAVLARAVDDGTDIGRERRKKLEASADILIPGLKSVPLFGDALEGIAARVKERLTRSLAEELTDLAAMPSSKGRSPLIVVDDLDRLQPEELLLVLQLVRLLGRLPQVHYLLAYDEETILDSIASTQLASGNADRALAYLEKIVQLKLDIPPLDHLQAAHELADGLTHILKENRVNLQSSEVDRFHLVHDLLIARTLTEPRRIRRYLAQVSMYLPLVDAGEIDVPDFLALTLLRMEYPALYRTLMHDGGELCLAKGEDPDPTARGRWRSITTELRHADHLARLLAHLFPALDERRNDDDVLAWIDDEERANSRRVCNSEYFQRYFTFGIPTDDLADVDVRRALDECLSGLDSERVEQLKFALNAGQDEGPSHEPGLRRQSADRRVRTIRKLSRLVPTLPPDQLVGALGLALNSSRGSEERSLLGSPADAVMEWLTSILKEVSTHDPGSFDFNDLAGVDQNIETLCRACTRTVAGEPPKGALAELFAFAVSVSMRVLETDLRSRRAGDLALDAALLARFCISWGYSEALRERLLELLKSDTIGIEDIVARFVTRTAGLPVTDENLIGFAKEPLIALFPLEHLVAMVESGPLPPASPTDTGWPLLEGVGTRHVMKEALEQQVRPPLLPKGTVVMPTQSKVWNQLSPATFDMSSSAVSVLRVRIAALRTLDPTTFQRAAPETREQELSNYLSSSALRRFVNWNSPSASLDELRTWVPMGINNDFNTELTWSPEPQSPLSGRIIVDYNWTPKAGILGSVRSSSSNAYVCVALEIGLSRASSESADRPLLPLRLPELNDLIAFIAQTCVGAIGLMAHDASGTDVRDQLFMYLDSPSDEMSEVIDLDGLETVPGGPSPDIVGTEAEFPLPLSKPGDLSLDDARLLASAVARALLEARQARGYAPVLHRLLRKRSQATD